MKKNSRLLAVVLASLCALLAVVFVWPSVAEARPPLPRTRVTTRRMPAPTKTPAPKTTPTKTPVPGNTPSPTPTPSGDKGVCGESMDTWHPPLVNGCATGHEHGDAPPAWVGNVTFVGDFNTSPKEDTVKHSSMKSFRVLLDSPESIAGHGCALDIYVRAHIAPNPLEQYSQFHSFELWVKDCAGNVSHEVGWLDRGKITMKGTPESDSTRPTAILVDRAAWDRYERCEQWYPGFGEAHPIGFTWMACDAETLYDPTNAVDPTDMSKWKLTGGIGTLRRTEVNYLPKSYLPRGAYWTTQFGDVVSGPTDARCKGTTTRYGVTYQNVCLQQVIQSTLTSIGGLRGDIPHEAQKQYDSRGVKVPN